MRGAVAARSGRCNVAANAFDGQYFAPTVVSHSVQHMVTSNEQEACGGLYIALEGYFLVTTVAYLLANREAFRPLGGLFA